MHALADRIAKAHSDGQAFTEATLFAPATGPKHTGILDEETILQPLSTSIAALFTTHPVAVSITVKTSLGKAYTLELLRASPTGEAPDVGVYDAGSRHTSSYTAGLHYQGALAGDERSLAAMSVFASGEVMILFSNADGNFVLGMLEDGSGRYILYNDRDIHGRSALTCGTLEPLPDLHKQVSLQTGKTARPMLCNKVRIYWEVGYRLFAYKSSSLLTTQNWATALFNQFQALYANERIAVELSSLYVWTTPDDYPTNANTSSAALSAFRLYWNSLGNAYNGELAHFLTRTNNGNGGIAYLDGLCTSPANSFSFAYSDLTGSFYNIPTFSWDVEVTTHETGHNLGSPHTHWCGWMTGAGGTCGAIDDCYTFDAGGGCNTCGSTYSNAAPTGAWQGTIMSYCHLGSRGINLANGFGAQPGDLIRTNVSAAACLQPALRAKLTPAPVCSNDGAISLQFAANSFGTAPYSYTWTGNIHTQHLSNIPSAGTYTVQVTDSNGCSQSFSADVAKGFSSGNGLMPSAQMPVCCNSYHAPLVLQASTPDGLTSCQSVYWLRSKSAFLSLADALAFVDTASTLNVLRSTNESSIANNSTGASLNVIPEVCTSPQAWYYTPVVVQQPKAADSFSYTANNNTSHTNFGTQIGTYVTLPDQSTNPTPCDLLDTPSSRMLSITVTNYTGRAGSLRFIMLDATGKMLYQSPGYAGNGTYAIPAAAIAGNFLQGMKIIAMDYNCSLIACTTSQATISASRKVVFAARSAKSVAACDLGQAIRVDFAPAGCTMLQVSSSPLLSDFVLAPNPATSSATLTFSLQQAAAINWKISDMAGRIISKGNGDYKAGSNAAKINLQHFARGVYVISLSDARTELQRQKLIIQ